MANETNPASAASSGAPSPFVSALLDALFGKTTMPGTTPRTGRTDAEFSQRADASVRGAETILGSGGPDAVAAILTFVRMKAMSRGVSPDMACAELTSAAILSAILGGVPRSEMLAAVANGYRAYTDAGLPEPKDELAELKTLVRTFLLSANDHTRLAYRAHHYDAKASDLEAASKAACVAVDARAKLRAAVGL